jgi:hypothetical protein
MKRKRKHSHDHSNKRKRQIKAFLQKYGMIIFALLAGLVLGKFIWPMFMK